MQMLKEAKDRDVFSLCRGKHGMRQMTSAVPRFLGTILIRFEKLDTFSQDQGVLPNLTNACYFLAFYCLAVKPSL